MSTRISSIGRIVAASTRHPLIVVFLIACLTLAALVFAAQNFAMTADTSQLISKRLDWRQRDLAFQAAFPQLNNLTMVVVDGATPELADDAAKRLAAALKARPDLFQSVRWPDGGSFFERQGLLFLPKDDVEATTSDLVRAAPLLVRLTADPSLRGTLVFLTDILQGLKQGETSLKDIEPTMTAFSKTFEDAVAGRPAFFSWRTVFTGNKSPDLREIRHVLLVQPVMDYAALEPGAAASDAIRTIAQSLALDSAHGVRVRLTGTVPLADEEFASLAQDAHVVLGAMLAALFGILWLAVRSVRVVLAITITTLIGLVLTAALGLLVIGRFNLLSMAFVPLFVGLGVDFSIQFSVRALAERLVQPSRAAALAQTGAGIGRPLALSAAAIGAGFFAFLPTSYIGVAELGTIAGLGMIVAFALCIVLLPALLVLLRFPSARMAEVGFTMLAPVDRFVSRHRFGVLASALVAAIVSVALLPQVAFDFDPLNLKSPEAESMTTLRALAADPDRTPYAINVLAPSLGEAQALAVRLSAVPEVSNVVTLQSLLPSQQTEKLEAVADAAAVIEPALEDLSLRSPPSDEELQQKLASTEAALKSAVYEAKEEPATLAVVRLAKVLAQLKAATPEVRSRAQAAVTVPLHVTLDQIRAQLKASPVTIATLPPDLLADWMTKDGQVRLQVMPRAGRTDNESLRHFAGAVQAVAPNATGAPIYTSASGDSVVDAFLQAAVYSAIVIIVLLAVVLRRARDVVLTLLPVLLSGLLTFATCGILGLPLNFTNIIALPLLFGMGVAFNIYFVMAWRRGETAMLTSSLMRAVVFSALMTANAFGALWLSTHPGTASMGRLLMIALGWELLVTLLFRPALLARSPQSESWLSGFAAETGLAIPAFARVLHKGSAANVPSYRHPIQERPVSSLFWRRSLPRLAAGVAAIALIGLGLVTMMSGRVAAADQDPAAQLVQRVADRVIEVARTSTGAAREAGMMRLLQAEFDLNYMARSTLGTHWDQATPEQRQRFLNVIASAEAHSYAQRFGQYTGQTVTVGRVTPRGAGVSLVDSKLNQSNGEPVAIQWEVRNDGQRLRIVDVKTEGVSMNLTRRSDYNSYIRNHGGQVEPLIAELEARAKR